jgi:CheY-like chemotaxis protein
VAHRDEITREMVDSALAIYFRIAYGTQPRNGLREAAGSAPLDGFADETRREEGDEEPLQRFCMRLGNRNYPYMKLVVQEHMVVGEFYFGADTHDHLEIRPDFPDYEAWMKVKRFNLGLKRDIEQAFAAAGLPTLASVRESTALLPGSPRRAANGRVILVIDDEEDEARAMEVLLRGEGYQVVLASDGKEALERLPFVRPDVVILDYEMPELDGLAVIRELRSHEETRALPILLTTACDVLQEEGERADEFLPKPFRSADLLRLVERLLAR